MPKMAKDFKTAHTVLISAVIWHVDPWPYLSAQQGLLSVWHMGGLFVSVGLKMEVREKKRELQSGQTCRRLDLEKKKGWSQTGQWEAAAEADGLQDHTTVKQQGQGQEVFVFV